MDMLYVLFNFLSIASVVLLLVSFKNNFEKLSNFQKISIFLVSVSVIIPFILGMIQGFLNQ